MRNRGQGPIALGVLIVLIGAAFAADRAGGKPEPAGSAGLAPSGAWVCPHGGGQSWRTTLYLANPGAQPSTVRVTSLGRNGSTPVSTITVPAGTSTHIDVPSLGRESSTLVDWFGSWVAAGWVGVAGGSESGVTAEPCGVAASTWFAPDGSTSQGSQSTYLVVANPSAAGAVFSVVLFAADRAPIRESDWTDLVLPGYTSVALRVNDFAVSEAAVSAEVDVSSGRVAVSSLGIGAAGGVRSAMASTSLSRDAILPVSGGLGQSELVLMAPHSGDVSFGAMLLSGRAAQPAGGLTQATQSGQSSRPYPIHTDGPSSVDFSAADTMVCVALRSVGSMDAAATGGAPSAAESWVVMPTVAGDPSEPGLVLVNPGSEAAEVTLHVLGAEGQLLPADVTVTVPPNSTAPAPDGFLQTAPQAPVLIRSSGGVIVALGASTSLGLEGTDGYALSIGVRLPGP